MAPLSSAKAIGLSSKIDYLWLRKKSDVVFTASWREQCAQLSFYFPSPFNFHLLSPVTAQTTYVHLCSYLELSAALLLTYGNPPPPVIHITVISL